MQGSVGGVGLVLSFNPTRDGSRGQLFGISEGLSPALQSEMDAIAPVKPLLLEAKFEQPEDTASPRGGEPYQHITIETNNCNGDDQVYYAITTDRWTFNDIAELVELLKRAGVE